MKMVESEMEGIIIASWKTEGGVDLDCDGIAKQLTK